MRRPSPPRATILLGLPATLAALLASSTLACAQSRPAPAPTPSPRAERSERTERSERAERRSSGRGVQVYRYSTDDDESDRAVLGVSTASNAGKRDTLGVMVQSVTAGGPAEKAGIEEGDRIAAINGVSLRLSPEDAGEPDMGGLMTHRLRREMEKVKPGATVELAVWSGGQTKTVRVATVAADSLSSRRVRLDRATMEERAVLGLNVSASGSRRDTLGALVSAVATDGPAEKAGIVEGDRIAAINGVDLRVAREDAGDAWASGVKLNRFQRELRKVKAGDAVELRVVTAGQPRTVRVTAVKAKDVYKQRADGGVRFRFGEFADGMDFGEQGFTMPMPPIPPMPPVPPGEVRFNDGDYEMLRSLGERFRTVRPVMPRGVEGRAFGGSGRRGRMDATLSGEGGTVTMSGLRLTRVNADLASYFGSGAEGGLLVTSSEGEVWKALREGDVILSVNGTPVRQGDRTRLSLDSRERTELEVLRKGKREKIVIDGEK